jgi:adenosylcobinamide kinase/adenosylcobinamide-phosphate guanylyltransferase
MILIIGGAYQGKKEYAKSNFSEKEIISDYHKRVKEQLKNGINPILEAEKLVKNKPDIVVVSDELGYGVVPVDAFDREYREVNGRINCLFAQNSERVIRVVCGVGTVLK